jgi:ribosomal protein S27AE
MIVILVYILGGIVALILGALLYFFAVSSRRTFKCPECGEIVTTEYLEAHRCGMCGTELKQL